MLSGRFSWVINCIPSSVHVNPNPPVHPTLPSTFGIRKFVSHVHVSISVLQTSSSVPFSFLPVSSSFSVRTDPHVDVFLICYWRECCLHLPTLASSSLLQLTFFFNPNFLFFFGSKRLFAVYKFISELKNFPLLVFPCVIMIFPCLSPFSLVCHNQTDRKCKDNFFLVY